MALYARQPTPEEWSALRRLAGAEATPARLARRARIILLSAERRTAPRIARQLGLAEKTIRQWVERFNAAGLNGLGDAPRPGRPRVYSEADRRRVVATARRGPPALAPGLPLPASEWTLDRLQAELNRQGVAMKRSQIRRVLKAKHVRWRRPSACQEGEATALD